MLFNFVIFILIQNVLKADSVIDHIKIVRINALHLLMFYLCYSQFVLLEGVLENQICERTDTHFTPSFTIIMILILH